MYNRIGMRLQQQREHEAGKARAGSEIDPSTQLGKSLYKLRRVGEMSSPQRGKRRSRDKVDFFLPSLQQLLIDLQLRRRLVKDWTKPKRGFAIGQRSFRHGLRARAARRVKAAGVMPSIR